eukprot:GHVU01055317.1.p1 GENE.GHVU01055317.1~~GHVU01055317.1.p1  ORF type:complete len:187 (+),score=24.43 GHVU01055317.1:2435-2995(+)
MLAFSTLQASLQEEPEFQAASKAYVALGKQLVNFEKAMLAQWAGPAEAAYGAAVRCPLLVRTASPGPSMGFAEKSGKAPMWNTSSRAEIAGYNSSVEAARNRGCKLFVARLIPFLRLLRTSRQLHERGLHPPQKLLDGAAELGLRVAMGDALMLIATRYDRITSPGRDLSGVPFTLLSQRIEGLDK